MKKPNDLRDHLLSSLPVLADNPDRLLIFVDEGRMVNTHANGLSFEYRYTLNIIITDFSEDMAVLTLAIYAWLRLNQPELLANLNKAADNVKFIADILDNSRADLSITIPLTERVIAKVNDGEQLTIDYPPEPHATRPSESRLMRIVDAKTGDVLGQFPTGTEEQHWMMEMPLVDLR
ncbi:MULTISPECIES: phage tail protein [Moraxella]|uniref:Phage tail protein n=1 Tax=Moraxella catarrhalis TaxID=480 RepID=A0A7Z0UXP1_MORCA|nr:phage tail protein [Moraxella catarrhalis]OAV00217.1 Phage tail protein [Moraxella catarrhalis]STY82485.1 P2 phage tail completion protein R (GpR) [Moraxella catarrhalis]